MTRENVTNVIIDALGFYVFCCAQIFFSRNVVMFGLHYRVK
jgi:DNA-directed RNA polymerase subunit N (RpoN/RPB10)